MNRKGYPEPEWFKLSRAAVIYDRSVPELFRACVRGDIENIHLTKPGKKRGVRLIRKASADAYFASFLPGGSRYQKTIPAEASVK
jgi:hypothetical protein